MESMLNRRASTYNLSNFQEFVTDRKRAACYGLDTLSYRYLQHWSLLPETQFSQLGNEFAVTGYAGYVKLMFKFLDFHMYVFVYITLTNFVKLSTLLIQKGSLKRYAMITALVAVWVLWSFKIFI